MSLSVLSANSFHDHKNTFMENLHHESKALDMRKQTICILFKKEISGEVLNEVDIIFIPFLPKQA